MKRENHNKLDELLKECEHMFDDSPKKQQKLPEEDFSFLKEKYV